MSKRLAFLCKHPIEDGKIVLSDATLYYIYGTEEEIGEAIASLNDDANEAYEISRETLEYYASVDEKLRRFIKQADELVKEKEKGGKE